MEVHLVFENVLREQGASSDTDVAASAGLEHSSRAPLGRLALDGVHAVLLTLALAVRPVFRYIGRACGLWMTSGACTMQCDITAAVSQCCSPHTRCLTDMLGNMRLTYVAPLVLSTLPPGGEFFTKYHKHSREGAAHKVQQLSGLLLAL